MKESITALEKKLRRKQNENINLMDNIEKLTKVELDRVSEIYELKEALEERAKECLKLSDDLAVKTKEQIDNIKVRDLECEIEDLKAACHTRELNGNKAPAVGPIEDRGLRGCMAYS